MCDEVNTWGARLLQNKVISIILSCIGLRNNARGVYFPLTEYVINTLIILDFFRLKRLFTVYLLL